MDRATRRTRGKSLWDVLVGLQLGVIGGVLMLAWFALISPVIGYPWWLILNASASYFYNSRDVQQGASVVTVVGIAVQIVTSGIVGCLSGLATPGTRLWGIGAAAGWYVLCLLFLWKRMAPQLLLPGIQPILWAGYFVFGSTLGWHGRLVIGRRMKARREALAG
jgi:hypothetical protein